MQDGPKIDDDESVQDHQRVESCIICQDEMPQADMYSCSNCNAPNGGTQQEQHFMCAQCFLGYANVELAGGAFEGIRYFGGDSSSALVSSPGNLPCPKFVTGDCETASIPLTTLFGALHESVETARLYYLASRRVMYQEIQQDVQGEVSTPDSSGTEGEDDNASLDAAIEAIKHRVQLALNRGAIVACPQCRQPGIKNAHCIHIRCHICATSFCYCCGRTRESSAESSIRCRGCDAVDSRLEMQPDWNTFAIGSESAAYGALHEFHRQRQAYFVQDVKMSTIPYQWQAFQAANPNILKDVPTPGRRIKWDELDSPIVPPCFGATRERDLLWAIRPRLNPTDVEQGDDELTEQNNEPEVVPETVLVPWSQVFRSRGGIQWIFLTVATVTLVATGLYFGFFSYVTYYGAVLGITGVLFYNTTIFLLLRMSDFFQLNPHHFVARWVPEVQFVGRRHQDDGQEGPYFSASGRWRQLRRNQLACPMMGVTVGGYLFGLSLVTDSKLGGAFGLLFLVPVLNTAFLQSIILNYEPLPPLDIDRQTTPIFFAQMMTTLHLHQFLIGLGAAFLYCELSPALDSAGIFLMMLCSGQTLAEILPRFRSEVFFIPRHRAMVRSRHFWFGLVILLYCLWFFFVFTDGAAIGAIILGPLLGCYCCQRAVEPEPNPPVEPEADLEEGAENAGEPVGNDNDQLAEAVLVDVNLAPGDEHGIVQNPS